MPGNFDHSPYIPQGLCPTCGALIVGCEHAEMRQDARPHYDYSHRLIGHSVGHLEATITWICAGGCRVTTVGTQEPLLNPDYGKPTEEPTKPAEKPTPEQVLDMIDTLTRGKEVMDEVVGNEEDKP